MSTDTIEDTHLEDILNHHVPCNDCDEPAVWLMVCPNGHTMLNRRLNNTPASYCQVHKDEWDETVNDDPVYARRMARKMNVRCSTCKAYLNVPIDWRPL
jgi:hypothetical protein